jgi:hypothetical protein
MLIANMPTTKIPTSLMVTIWSLRSVPISMLVLMFVFNSGSIQSPHPNLQFWLDAIAILGVVGIVTYWSRLQRFQWNTSLIIYLYIFSIFIFRNPYSILNVVSHEKVTAIDWQSILNSFWVGVGIFILGAIVELMIFQLYQFNSWAWWLSLGISILYVASIIFFFSGTLGIWSLLDPDTKKAFKSHQLNQHRATEKLKSR